MGVHIGYVCIRLNGLTNSIDLHNSDFVLLFICMLSGSFLGWWVGGLVGWLAALKMETPNKTIVQYSMK